jgi:hypothetical protein
MVAQVQLQRPGLVGEPHCPALVCRATLGRIRQILLLISSLADGNGSVSLCDGDPGRILLQQSADLDITGLQELLLLLVPR